MGFVALGQKCLGAFLLENNSYYDRILCCMSESKGTLKFEFGGGIVVVKYVLCIVTILLLVVDAFIYFDLKKYIKVHENELVENHIKGLLGRAIAMTVISVCVGVIAIILQIM